MDDVIERSIPLPGEMIFGDAIGVIDDLNGYGFKCKLIANEMDNEIWFMIEFETKEKAVEAKLKYL